MLPSLLNNFGKCFNNVEFNTGNWNIKNNKDINIGI